MFFLNPAYLWALLGLAVPVAIHLWSKKEGRTIRIGSIQLLRESDPRQTSHININELWLLLLRMFTLTFLVLIIAEPQLKRKGDTIPVTYIIEPSLLSYSEVNSILDTLETGSLRLLQKGFPELKREGFENSTLDVPNYWQLAQEMEQLPTDSIVVFTNAFASGFKGRRPEINKNINWIILDPGKPEKELISATKNDDKVELVSVLSDAKRLGFEKDIVPVTSDRISINSQQDSVYVTTGVNETQLALTPVDSLTVLFFHNDSLDGEIKYLRSSFGAISKYLDRTVEVQIIEELDSIDLRDKDAVVWLSAAPVVETSLPLLVYRQDSLAVSLIEKGSSENIFHLTTPLNSENIIEEHLAEQLLKFLNLNTIPQEKIAAYDKRVIDGTELLPVDTEAGNHMQYAEIVKFSQWLWILLVVLLIAERALARYRRQ